jgi:hypothetical protein
MLRKKMMMQRRISTNGWRGKIKSSHSCSSPWLLLLLLLWLAS